MDYCMIEYINPDMLVYISASFKTGLMLLVGFAILLTGFSLVWFNYWEGAKENE